MNEVKNNETGEAKTEPEQLFTKAQLDELLELTLAIGTKQFFTNSHLSYLLKEITVMKLQSFIILYRKSAKISSPFALIATI